MEGQKHGKNVRNVEIIFCFNLNEIIIFGYDFRVFISFVVITWYIFIVQRDLFCKGD